MIRFGQRKPRHAPSRSLAIKPSASRRLLASTESAPTESAPTESAPTESAPTESAPTESVPTESVPTESALTESAPTESAPTESAPTESAPTESAPTDEGFAGDEERFFNEPAAFSSELEASDSEEPRFSSTLAPTVISSTEAPGVPSEHERRDTLPDHAVLESRRKRLRRAVLITLCAGAAVLLIGIARSPARGIRTNPSAATPHGAATPPALASGSRIETVPPPLALASASAATHIDDRAAEESARSLVRTARSLLQAGRIRAGVTAARQALAANSSDAEPYILLAAGLQDLGDWSGAQTVFTQCNEKARHGSNADCRYFSSRNH